MDSDYNINNIIETFLLFQAFFIPGINNSVLGPNLLDLQSYFQIRTFHKMTFLLTLSGAGTIAGCFLSKLIPRTHPRLRLATSVLGASLTCMVSTVVPSLHFFLVMFFICSTFKGLVICYGIEMCNFLWNKKGAAIQFVLAGMSLGAVLSPLVSEPFLSCIHEQQAGHSRTLDTDSPDNTSMSFRNNSGAGDLISVATFTSSLSEEGRRQTAYLSKGLYEYSETHVQWVFVVLGGSTVPAGLAMLYYVFKHKNSEQELLVPSENYQPIDAKSTTLNKLAIVMTVLVIMFGFVFTGLTSTHISLLTIFGVKGPPGLSKSTMIKMTSVFWVSSIAGKMGSSALTTLLGTGMLIALNLFFLVPVMAVFIIWAPYNAPVLWVTNICLGVFSAPLTGAVFSYAAENLALSQGLICFITLSSGVGNMVLPYLASVLMRTFWPLGHLYLMAAVVAYMIVTFASMTVLKAKVHAQIMKEECNSIN